MPIKKRTTLPSPPPTKPHRVRTDPYKLPGRPLGELLSECNRKASDAAWAGDEKEAAKYTRQANDYRARIDAGELYEVDF